MQITKYYNLEERYKNVDVVGEENLQDFYVEVSESDGGEVFIVQKDSDSEDCTTMNIVGIPTSIFIKMVKLVNEHSKGRVFRALDLQSWTPSQW